MVNLKKNHLIFSNCAKFGNAHGGNRMKYDAVIIGAGVTGSSIARELSKYKLKICVIEAHSDVCEETSKANSGIVHVGFDAKPGSLKAKLNVLGSKMMESLSKDLDFHYRRNGAMIVAFNEEQISKLRELAEQSIENGAGELEPSISEEIEAALLVKNFGIVSPFNITIALAENAAGVYGAEIHNMVLEKGIDGEVDTERIIPRRGEYYLYDHTEGHLVNRIIIQVPTKLGKGVLVTPTIHRNLMVGPNAQDLEDKEANIITEEGLEEILKKVARSIKTLPNPKKIITSFAGLRAHRPEDDFKI